MHSSFRLISRTPLCFIRPSSRIPLTIRTITPSTSTLPCSTRTIRSISTSSIRRDVASTGSLEKEEKKDKDAKEEEKEEEDDDEDKKKEEKPRESKENKESQELEAKDKEIAKLKDAVLRSRADFENLQKTTSRQISTSKDFAIQSFAKDLVSSIDILSLALTSIPPTKLDKSVNPDLTNLWEGVNLTKAELLKVLGRFGVNSFDPTGEKFDPNRHEAMYQAPVPGKEPGTVLECSKVGYMIKDRLLRPAQVGVVLEAST